VETNYKEGDLVIFKRNKGCDLCIPTDLMGKQGRQVKEYVITAIPLDFFEVFTSLEEKVGLIVKVSRNKLDQPLGYQVQIGQDIWFFKSVLAQKYFTPLGDQSDERRRAR
jgi:hypothetical protein